MKLKKRIILIYGGEGCECEISKKSAKSLYAFIDKSKFQIIPVFISTDGSWYITDGISDSKLCPTYPVRINSRSGLYVDGDITEVDLAIPVLHGDFGEDGIIQGALDCAHIPYLGCGVFASAVCADKICTKIIAEHLKIPSAKFVATDPSTTESEAILRAEAAFSYPMFLKPSGLGSSIGAARANTRRELSSAFAAARAISERILIEECVDVLYELECGTLTVGAKTHVSPSGRIYTNGAFYDYGGKYLSKDSPKTAHGVRDNPEIMRLAAEYSEALIRTVGIRTLSRIDFFYTRSGELLFNEINTLPGMTETSLYPLLTEDMGFPKNEYINILISEAVK